MDSPFYQIPMWDAQEYHQMARVISKGSIPDYLAYRPPLYPLLLGVIYMLFGDGALIPRLLQIFIGVISCVLVQRIGSRLFGNVCGFFAGIIASITGLIVYFDLELLPTSLYIFLMLLMINEMLKIESGTGSALKAGIWFSLGCLCRPTLLTFFPIAVLWLWNGGTGKKKTGMFGIAVLAFLLFSTVSHIAIKSGPVIVSSQGGVNFFIGNNVESDGMTARLPGFGAGWSWDTIESWAEAYKGKPLTPAAVDKVFWGLGFSEIQSDVGGFLNRTIRKAGLFWNRYEISSNRDLYYHGRSFPIIGFLMKLSFVLFLPFALVGFFANLKSRNTKLIVYLLVVYYLSTLPFFVNARFRHPLTPFLIVGSMGAIQYLIKQFGKREYPKNLIVIIIAFFIGTILPFSTSSGIDPERWDYGLFTEGKALERSGRTAEAEQNYILALEHNPRAPYVNYHLGELMRARGNLNGAVNYFQQELEIQPQFGKGWNELGVVQIDRGNQDKALQCFERAVSVQPGLKEAARNAARIYAYKGIAASEMEDWTHVYKNAKRANDLEPADPIYRVLLLESRFHMGDTVGISNELGSLLKEFPSLPPVIELSALLHSKINSR
ncbi:MAG: hypothetical protein HN356_06320 [Calditrichaeota bacterium]|nr:hypothetical protein [Calditrichota bacterium]